MKQVGLPQWLAVKNLPVSAGDTGLAPGLRKSHILRSN